MYSVLRIYCYSSIYPFYSQTFASAVEESQSMMNIVEAVWEMLAQERLLGITDHTVFCERLLGQRPRIAHTSAPVIDSDSESNSGFAITGTINAASGSGTGTNQAENYESGGGPSQRFLPAALSPLPSSLPAPPPPPRPIHDIPFRPFPDPPPKFWD